LLIAVLNSVTSIGRLLVTVSVAPARSIPTAWTPGIVNAASATARTYCAPPLASRGTAKV
jgi:hypothetical protein